MGRVTEAELHGSLDVALLALAAEGGDSVVTVLRFLITGVMPVGTLVFCETLAEGPYRVRACNQSTNGKCCCNTVASPGILV